jgi:trigger factor
MSSQTQYTLKSRGETEATIEIVVSSGDFKQEVESVYRRYSHEVQVPGFRKGHVPRSYLESRFGRDAFIDEAKEELQRKHFSKAIDELDLRPVATPKLEEVSFDPDDAYVFEATFATLPEVKLPEYKGLEVSVPPAREIGDEDVQRTLEEIQTQFGTLGEKEGETVADGDIVRVREGEQEWDTRADAENPVTRGLIGKSMGETVKIDAELPEGKRLQTSLEVLGLKQVVLPEIDDELAKDAGFESLDALKTDIQQKLSEGEVERRQRRIDGSLLEKLVDACDVPLPDAFVDELTDEEIERIKASLERERSSLTFEEYLARRNTTEEQLRGEIRESVSSRVRRELVLRALEKAEGISIDEAELGEVARHEAEEAGEDPLRFVARLKAEDRWEDYRAAKLNERLFAVLRESAVVSDKEE